MKTLSLQTTYYEYLLQSYQEWLQTIGYADPTIKNWPAHVRELLHYLESKNILHITLVTSHHLQDFIRHVKYRQNASRPGALSSSSINTIINAVNSFSRYINSSGKYVLDFILERMEDDAAIPTLLTVQEIRQLYDATFLPHRENCIAMGQRDRAIIAVFYGCGLRKMEGTMLNITDIDLHKRLLLVRKGKGNKQRYVPIAHKHAEDIRSYLEEGREWFLYEHYARDYTSKYAKRKEAPDNGAFFIGQHGGRMKRFYQRLEYLKEKAGLEKQFGLHTLRHSIATHLFLSGMAIEEISRFLGHSSLDSTQIYVHLAHELKNNAYG
jgi:integrase/recombinase XerD